MGDEDHRRIAGAHQRQHLVLQALARHRIERAERLVHQQRLRLLRQAACNLQTLLHAAGHFRRIFLGMIGQAYLFQQFVDAGGALRSTGAGCFQRQRNIAGRGPPRQQRLAVILKDDGNIAARRQHRLVVEGHAAAGGLIESGCKAQCGGLAAAGRADDAKEFTRLHVKADVLDDRLAAEIERDVGKYDLGFLRTRSFGRMVRRRRLAHDLSFLAGG
jgi:hypothetical protein